MRPARDLKLLNMGRRVHYLRVEKTDGTFSEEWFDENKTRQKKTGTMPFSEPTTGKSTVCHVVIRYRDDRSKECYYDEYGELHREGGPAVILKTAKKETKIHFSHGKIEAMWGHAVEIKMANGWRIRKWYENGKPNDTVGCGYVFPAVEVWDEKYRLRCQEYRRNGVLHRENDLPAWIERGENGIIQRRKYFQKGVLSRDNDKPADVEYDKRGYIRKATWYVDGLPHRIGAPAYIEYDKNGNPIKERWFMWGVEIEPPTKHTRKKIAKLLRDAANESLSLRAAPSPSARTNKQAYRGQPAVPVCCVP